MAPNSVFMMSGESLPELVAYLNSSLAEYLFSTMGTTTGMGTIRWQKQNVELIPVPHFSNSLRMELQILIERILTLHYLSEEWEDCRRTINDHIVKSVDLTEKEYEYIETNL